VIKFVFCVKRKEDQTRESFRETWEKKHQPLIFDFAEKARVVRMSVSFGLAVQANVKFMKQRGTDMPFDAVIELWINSPTDFQKFLESDEAKKMREEMEKVGDSYIDIEHSSAFFADENVLIGLRL